MSSRMCPQSLFQLQLPFPIQTRILALRPLSVCLPTHVEPHVSALPVSHGHPSASHFQDDLAPNHNTFVSPRPPLSGNRSVGIETWAQNLTTPRLQSVPNQQASPPIPNITLPTFWETDVDLWFAAVDQIFASNGIWDEQRKFSVALNSLDLKYSKGPACRP